MGQEACENCGGAIGNLEQAHLYNGKVVCNECVGKLRDPIPTYSMDSKPDKVLDPAEQILLKVSPAMFRNRPIFFILCVLLIPVGIGLLILLYWLFQCEATSLTVTTKRTVFRQGILSKRTNEVRHKDVRNIQVEQPILQRLFGVGTIAISSSGQSEMEIMAEGIPEPQKIADMIRSHQG
jgi:hypothetical protein